MGLRAKVCASLLTLVACVAAAETPAKVKNVVLVHGLYADGSSWAKVVPILQKAGLHVTAVQNPTTSLADDVEATRRALAQQDGPTILVGHSYGGMVISEAGTDAKVSALVYVAARAPDAGEDYPALAKTFPPAPAGKGLAWGGDGFGRLSEEAFVRDFAGDLDPAQARVYYAVQQPVGRAVTTAKTTVAAWRAKPSWYVVSKQDRTIDPDFQRFMAKRMNATTTEVDASHVSMISRPEEIAQVILAASRAEPKP
ncbi:alpha/beta fold hydrolase [Piscinibacter terrae]|uniref:Alpha/beta hydrolase n=1 Tax=Piscinibacter terrae TaxID=2496871 RepID=A0A3N7HRS7_9BURK|nr:alpha/beta hydrolase [Albitalea terrae]RQP23501.1 alpha/beta hydrolase [Albitalea terrae]